MIKRIVGRLAAAAVLAVIVFTILGYGTYASFIEQDIPPATAPVTAFGPQPDAEAAVTAEETVTVDTLAVERPASDSTSIPAEPISR